MQRSTVLPPFAKPQACNNGVNTMPILIAALILSLKTDGGFTGRGLGEISINGEKVTTERCDGTITKAEQSELTAAIAAAKKMKWHESYGHAAPDAVQWTLEIDDRKASWYDSSEVPKELAALKEAAWNVRGRVIASCR